ncbi:hypothetical protein SDC9_204127 [bioreactor metagenome]|uniref:Uncharacterized protein n=1 Tax=bioreactor metagenome TaxID=1076179 RepID=A0A645IYE5_9ZZZZ
MEEIDARQGGGNRPSFLVHIVALAGNVGIMAEEDKGTGVGRGILPTQLRVAVAAETNMVSGVGHAKGMVAGDALAIRKTCAGQFHELVSSLFGGPALEVAQAETESP